MGWVMRTRRWVLAGLMAGVASPVLAKAKPKAKAPAVAEVPAILAEARLERETSFVVADAATGRILESHQPDLPRPPASTLKTLTTLFALEHLGPDHRFVTTLEATGPLRGGVVQGDIILRGTGDPTLDTDRLGDLAASLARAGVRAVTGGYFACDGALPRLDRISDEQPVQVGYDPGLSGLNLNFNRVNFEWKPGKAGALSLQMDARGERFLPLVRMARVDVADRDRPMFTHATSAQGESWTVARAALGRPGSRWLPVARPGLYAGEVFQTLARAQGIDLPEVQVVASCPPGTRLAASESGQLSTLLRDMLKHSTNLTAEVMGLSASGAGGLRASANAMGQWAQDRFGVSGEFVDHSGLGGESRITAAEMVVALRAAQATPTGRLLPGLLRDMGLRDEDGAALVAPGVKVLAKTGTLNFVSGLVGHVLPATGRPLVFAIYSADTARRDAVPMEERERPVGTRSWVARARTLQARLITRWAAVYAV